MTDNAEAACGAALRAARIAAGWSQQEVADRMPRNWRQARISRIELGQLPLRLNDADCLAAVFGMSLSELLSNGKSDSAAARRREIERNVRKRIAAEILAKA